MSEIRIKISSASISETVVAPIFNGEFTRKLERNRVFYLHEPKGNLVFYGQEYTLIKDLENDCEKVFVTVERQCDGEWSDYWTGSFTKFNCKFDYFRCTVEAEPTTESLYKCVFDSWETEENVYNGTGPVMVVRSLGGTYEPAVYFCTDCRPAPDVYPCATHTDACIEPGYPKVVDFNSPNCDPAHRHEIHTFWHRETGLGTPTVPPTWSTGWTLLTGSTWWRCPDYANADLDLGILRWGRRFDAVLEHMVDQLGCGITVRSHFFGINATHPAPPSGDVYDYAVLKYQNMTVHQKSDVKRPDGDPSFSFVWKMKLKTLLDDLNTIFNVFWKLDVSGSMILEHISYFEALAGADYSDVKMSLEIDYDVDTPKSERFKWSDEDCNSHFKGQPITYDCGSNENERRVSLFSTDAEFIHTEANQDSIVDSNFVLICNRILDTGVYIIDDKNKALGWTSLHENLHLHYRHFMSGSINGHATDFLSTQKIKKQPDFTVPFCCDEPYDETAYVTTPIGQGRIQLATENLYRDTLKLQLNY